MELFFQLTFAPLMVAVLSSLACALPGNFILLRRQALVGDAISHVVLPGIVVAFLVTGSSATWPMLIGAGAAAMVAVGLVSVIKRLGRLEPGAALGIVLTTMFAVGVLLLEQSSARSVHLDVEHALYGNLESIIWFAGDGPAALLKIEALASLPPQIPRLLIVLIIIAAFTVLFWKEQALSTFDPEFAASVGVPVKRINLALIMLVAVAAVASFDAVGAIIVIAMFVCPAAAARLMTNRLVVQVGLSLALALAASVIGYALASFGPYLFGSERAVSAAGMIASVSGVILGLSAVFGPCRKRAHTAAPA